GVHRSHPQSGTCRGTELSGESRETRLSDGAARLGRRRARADREEGRLMSTDRKNLLVELFVEELPPKALKRLGEAFAAALAEGLRSQGLVADDASVTAFA